MKKSILISILILMMFLSLNCELILNSDYQEYNDNHQLNYQFIYSKTLSNYKLSFQNELQKSNNKVFDQVTSLNEYYANFGINTKGYNHGLLLKYKRKDDHYPQYQIVGDVVENQYFTGYYIDIPLTDSLLTKASIEYAFSQEDNPNVSGKTFHNKGYLSDISSNFGFNLRDNNFHLDLIYNHDNRTRKYNNQLSAILSQNLDSSYLYIYNQLYYQTSQDDIYTLQNSSNTLVDADYVQTDTQNRDNFRFISQVVHNTGERLYGYLESVYSKNNNRFSENRNRSSSDNDYDLNLNFKYQLLDKMLLVWENHYNISRKYLSLETNNRESDTKKVKFGFVIDNVFLDSLTVTQSMEKTSTNFPKAVSGFDNDYISEVLWISARKLFADKVNLNNQFSYSKTQYIYINSKYSASNNIKSSYSYNPDIDILIGDKLLLSQLYSIRINYDDYIYDTLSNNDVSFVVYDRFYRQVSAEFKIRYDNYPVRDKLNLAIWKKTNDLYSIRDNLNLIISYKYFANETGDKKSEIYETTGQSVKHDFYILAEKSYGPLILSVKPKATWGNTKIYEIDTNLTYEQSEDTKISINIKPRYEVEEKELVYTINTLLGVRF